jgi:predicted metal-dependent RNase
VIDRKGSVLVPVFAMGKTQEVLAMLHRFKAEGLIPKHTPVYIGGLSTKMTHVYDRFSEVSRRHLPGFRFSRTWRSKAAKKAQGPHPLRHRLHLRAFQRHDVGKNRFQHFARQGILENKRHGLFFVGYADPETPAADPRGETRREVMLDRVSAGEAALRMRIFDFSGHSTREAIADYIVKGPAEKVFLVHGDDDAVEWFRQEIQRRLPDTQAIVPLPGEEHNIVGGRFRSAGSFRPDQDQPTPTRSHPPPSRRAPD